MNAEVEVGRLLREHNAVLVRQKNHLVYRLPNGQNFVQAKTSSDPIRAAKNNLSDLRRALGIERVRPEAEGATMQMQQMTIAPAPPPSGVILAQALTAPTPDGPAPESLKVRVEAAIAEEEAAQERLLASAQLHERRVLMLKALLPFADYATMEDALRGVLPTVEPAAPEPPPPPPPEPPQQITNPVQVTRQLVLAAAHTFESTFTVNEVLACMSNGAVLDKPERQRVRSSIAGAMMALLERGEVIRVAEGWGKRQAIWKRAVLNGNGNGSKNGVGTRA